MVTPVLTDLTFDDLPPRRSTHRVFCDHGTGKIHLNSNYSPSGEDAMSNEKHYEENMGSIIIHEAVHLILADMGDWGTSCKWDRVDRKLIISNSLP